MDRTTAIVVFNVLCSLGFAFALFFILVAFFSKKVSRLPTWYLIMSIGALYSLSMLLLVGSQVQDEEPHYDLCLAQASLVYALPVGLTSAGATFAIQLYLTLKHFILKERTRLSRNSLIVLSRLFQLGVLHPDEVSRAGSHMYCRLEDSIAGRVSGVLCGLSGLTLLIVQGFTVALLWPRWRSSAATNLGNTSGGLVSRGTILRLVVLDVMALSAVLLGILKGVIRYSSVVMNLYIAALTLVGMFTFGVSTLPFKKSAPPPSSDVESAYSVEADKASVAYSSRAATPMPDHPMTVQ
ncbi:hypothetical protein DL96DRAFT_1576603 [Flagelloscypha sp. PMI_526]|nr:hypothetical protein DL96DRAFT_1576603 [Flagelloscypha sp. PMI_526]